VARLPRGRREREQAVAGGLVLGHQRGADAAPLLGDVNCEVVVFALYLAASRGCGPDTARDVATRGDARWVATQTSAGIAVPGRHTLPISSEDERLFVLPQGDVVALNDVPTLEQVLQEVLGRKVWILAPFG